MNVTIIESKSRDFLPTTPFLEIPITSTAYGMASRPLDQVELKPLIFMVYNVISWYSSSEICNNNKNLLILRTDDHYSVYSTSMHDGMGRAKGLQ